MAAPAPDGRAAAHVDHLDGRGEADGRPAARRARTEVHVFPVQEEPLVEQSDGHGIGPAHEQAGAADPGHRLRRVESSARPTRARARIRRCCARPSSFCHASPQGLGIGPNDSSARPCTVHEARADGGGLRIRPQQRATSASMAPRGTTVSGLSSRTSSLLLSRNARLLPAPKPTLPGARISRTRGNAVRDHLGRAVGRAVVHDDDVVRAARRRGRQ